MKIKHKKRLRLNFWFGWFFSFLNEIVLQISFYVYFFYILKSNIYILLCTRKVKKKKRKTFNYIVVRACKIPIRVDCNE